MGQVMNKGKGKVDAGQTPKQQQTKDLQKSIESCIDEIYKDNFEETIKRQEGFYQAVYQIVEKLSEKHGAMQFRLPTLADIEKEYKAACGDVEREHKLTKDEFKKIINNLVSIDKFYVGKGAQDIFLFIFGVPVLALLAKRLIPGTRSISDDVFIPAATTGTVIFLAKTNRL